MQLAREDGGALFGGFGDGLRQRLLQRGNDVVPIARADFAILPTSRESQPLIAVDVLPAEAAFVAHEVALRHRVRPRRQAIELVFVLIDVDAATGAAAWADALGRLQPPDALLVQEIRRTERPDRADVVDVS